MIDRVLSDYMDAWNAGRRPDVDAYLERVPEAERDELAGRLEAWLAIAPTPAYPAAARRAIRADPRLRVALAEVASDEPRAGAETPRAGAASLRALRRRAGLGLDELAARVVAAFGLAGQEARAAGYLERLEHGELDESGLSRRLLKVLADALGADLRPAAPAPAMLFRGEGESLARELEELSRAALEPAPKDELDRLFTGGPEG
jgi:transcriptional regulator with XRE-family HTH domain